MAPRQQSTPGLSDSASYNAEKTAKDIENSLLQEGWVPVSDLYDPRERVKAFVRQDGIVITVRMHRESISIRAIKPEGSFSDGEFIAKKDLEGAWKYDTNHADLIAADTDHDTVMQAVHTHIEEAPGYFKWTVDYKNNFKGGYRGPAFRHRPYGKAIQDVTGRSPVSDGIRKIGKELRNLF